jgi:SAM-dependent methyltransferase
MAIPSWKLPPGVCRGTWDYIQSIAIAREYDQRLTDSPLLQLDQQFIQHYLPDFSAQSAPPLIADLGCGTGRISRLLSPRGYRLLNVDLSAQMLSVLQQRCQHPELNQCVQANLVELDCLQPHSLDLALCLFSSIGMIQGQHNRRAFLKSVRPALKPAAPLILHVHNRYHSLWHPSGPTWLTNTWLKSKLSNRWEFGDKVFVDLGLPNMFLHIYSYRELLGDLRAAGFERIEVQPINVRGDDLLAKSVGWSWRAGGFFAVARHK